MKWLPNNTTYGTFLSIISFPIYVRTVTYDNIPLIGACDWSRDFQYDKLRNDYVTSECVVIMLPGATS